MQIDEEKEGENAEMKVTPFFISLTLAVGVASGYFVGLADPGDHRPVSYFQSCSETVARYKQVSEDWELTSSLWKKMAKNCIEGKYK